MRSAISLWAAAVAAVVFAAPARGADVPARIAADTTWDAAGSPYHVAADARVESGVGLTIEPGVTVTFAAGASLVVAGRLVARGTEDAPVTFTGAPGPDGTPARWGSVLFEDSAEDATFDGDVYVGGSLLERCVFERGTRALRLEGASPYVHATTFRDNYLLCGFDLEGGAALRIGEGSAPRVRGCVFEDNEGAGLCHGGAVYVHEAAPILQDNVFRRNKGAYGGALSTFFMASPIVGNLFEDNESLSEGGAISLVSSIPAILDNELRGNHAYMDGGAVHVCVTCFPHANPFLHDNVVTGNTCRLEGAAGVGAAFLRGFTHNTLTGNLRDGEPADFAWHNAELDHYPARVTTADVSRNWWGTTDAAAIDRTIFDGADEPGLGPVSWFPPLAAPTEGPTPRVTITTRKLRYTDPGEPLPLFLTVYNPGAARTVDLALFVDYGEGLRAFWRAPLGLAGETAGHDTHRLPLAAGAVYFSELTPPPYAPPDGLPEGTWTAALFDADSGAPVGEPCTIGFELTRAPGIGPGEEVPR